MDGVGIFRWADGREYIGENSYNLRNGYGIYQFVDGRLSIGTWLNGKQTGLFTYKDEDNMIR